MTPTPWRCLTDICDGYTVKHSAGFGHMMLSLWKKDYAGFGHMMISLWIFFYNFLLIIRFETISTKKLPKMYYKIMSLKILKYSIYKNSTSNYKLGYLAVNRLSG